MATMAGRTITQDPKGKMFLESNFVWNYGTILQEIIYCMIFFLFNDAESLVWTHHDIAEILLKYWNINTTQSINVVVDILVNFVNSSMRKLKTMIMVSKNRIVLWIPALEYFPIYSGISIRAGTRRYVAASNEWYRRFDC